MVVIQITTQLEDKIMLRSIKYIIYYIIFMILLFSASAFSADPILIIVTKDTWQKVATDVTTGQIHIVNTGPDSYSQTYRVTGNSPPTLFDEAVRMHWGTAQNISSSSGIDVYVYCKGKDGKIRLDLQ